MGWEIRGCARGLSRWVTWVMKQDLYRVNSGGFITCLMEPGSGSLALEYIRKLKVTYVPDPRPLEYDGQCLGSGSINPVTCQAAKRRDAHR